MVESRCVRLKGYEPVEPEDLGGGEAAVGVAGRGALADQQQQELQERLQQQMLVELEGAPGGAAAAHGALAAGAAAAVALGDGGKRNGGGLGREVEQVLSGEQGVEGALEECAFYDCHAAHSADAGLAALAAPAAAEEDVEMAEVGEVEGVKEQYGVSEALEDAVMGDVADPVAGRLGGLGFSDAEIGSAGDAAVRDPLQLQASDWIVVEGPTSTGREGVGDVGTAGQATAAGLAVAGGPGQHGVEADGEQLGSRKEQQQWHARQPGRGVASLLRLG